MKGMTMISFHWWLIYLGAGLATMLISMLLTRWFRNLAHRRNLLDRPLNEEHKQHTRAVPVLGGPPMYLSWLLVLGGGVSTLLLLGQFKPDLLPESVLNYLPGLKSRLPQAFLLLFGATALLAMGLIDDRKPLRASIKFAVQILAVLPFLIWGGEMARLTFFCKIAWINIAVTLGWYILVVNAINFFDNMDALAGGTAAIATFSFSLIAALHGQFFVATLGAVICGAAIGFLVYNSPPATIFMGDAGSHFLGFCLATLGVLTNFYMTHESQTLAPMLIPLLVLAVPLSDSAVVVFIRLREKRPIYKGDNSHISHRFTHLGFSRRFSVLLIHLLNLVVCLGAVALIWMPPTGVVVILVQIAAVLAAIYLIQLYGWLKVQTKKN
jgi:UDP-GlcNAc:undecaprenyl-phosphate GlcNAc-1-phosphate transferase